MAKRKIVKLGAREQFCAREGCVLVAPDFRMAELCSVSQICLWEFGYSELAKILNNLDRDAHLELGTRIYAEDPTIGKDAGATFHANGVTWREQYAWGYTLQADLSRRGIYKDVRNLAKGPGFGLWGGMGADRLIDYCHAGYGVDLTLEQSRKVIAIWKEMLPETNDYFDMVKKNLAGGRKVKYGEKIRGTITQYKTGRIRGQVGFCDASNGYFQSLTADYKKEAMRALWIEMYARETSPLYGCRMLDDVHDEIVSEVPRARLAEIGPYMSKVIIDAAQPYCPDVKLIAETSACYRYSKAAGDPVFNKHGELIPWEEKPGYDGAPPPDWNLATYEKWKAVA